MTLHSEKKKKADSDFVYSHGTPRLCPTFISCAEKKNSAQTLAWSFEKAPFTHNETICARVCADASVGGGRCVRVLAYTHAFFAAVHVCASANTH